MADNITGVPLTSDYVEPGNPITVGSGSASDDLAQTRAVYDDVLNNQPRGKKNPLSFYKTFNYLFTLAIIPTGIYNNGSYPSPGNLPNILIRSQGDWRNCDRVTTEFGSFDYYLDNLIISTIVTPTEHTGNTINGNAISFEVLEPYSMGLFAEAIAAGAINAGYLEIVGAVFILAIEFAGYTDNDVPHIDSSLTKYITLNITDMTMSVTNAGCRYNITANSAAGKTLNDGNSETKFDHQLHGITVEDFISKNVKGSLQFALNRALNQLVSDKTLASTDKIEITFPENPNLPGVTNTIGKAKLFKDNNSAGAQPQPDLDKIYDKQNKIYKETYNVKEDRVTTIPKATPIISAIKEIILRSDYISNQMPGGKFNTDSMGMINWFIIKTRNEFGEFNPQMNRHNMKWIYEILPWKVQIDKFVPPGTQPPGYDQLRLNIPKVYDYIYTGKNTEIISWNIRYNNTLADLKPVDLTTNAGTAISNVTGDAGIKQTGKTLPNAASVGSKEISPMIALTGAKEFLTTGNAGSGTDVSTTTNTRMLSRIINGAGSGTGDMINLDMVIHGDPHWISNDVSGNKIVPASTFSENTDGSTNTFSGKVYVIANFRTPIDIDPVSGLYKFTATLDTISGIYEVTSMEHRFEKGKFTQRFANANRLRAQLTTSGKGSGFGISEGRQGQGGYLAAGNTSILGAAFDLLGGANVFGSGLPIPNLGGVIGGLSRGIGSGIGSAIGGVVNNITSGVGDIVGNLTESNDSTEE